MNDFYILLAQFFSTCLLQYFYICLEKIKQIKNSKKLFKFYSKIILWQRYASWLRAYRPCIHSQWSVS